MSSPIDAALALQAHESARQLIAAVRPDGAMTGLGDQLAAVTGELCWEVGLVDVDEPDLAALDGETGLPALGRPRLDHVGVLVADLRQAFVLWGAHLGGTLVAGGDAAADGIRTAHLRYPGGGKVELLTPIGPGPAADHLERRGEGVHHLTFAGFDVGGTAATLRGVGIPLGHLDVDSSYMRQLFVGPRAANGVAVQVVDRSDHYASAGPERVPTLDELLEGRWSWSSGVPVEVVP